MRQVLLCVEDGLFRLLSHHHSILARAGQTGIAAGCSRLPACRDAPPPAPRFRTASASRSIASAAACFPCLKREVARLCAAASVSRQNTIEVGNCDVEMIEIEAKCITDCN